MGDHESELSMVAFEYFRRYSWDSDIIYDGRIIEEYGNLDR